jgi:hypothetical protein
MLARAGCSKFQPPPNNEVAHAAAKPVVPALFACHITVRWHDNLRSHSFKADSGPNSNTSADPDCFRAASAAEHQ